MSDPEPDAIFRARLIQLVEPELRPFVRVAIGSELDAIGRKLDRFRYGVPLKMGAALVRSPKIEVRSGMSDPKADADLRELVLREASGDERDVFDGD